MQNILEIFISAAACWAVLLLLTALIAPRRLCPAKTCTQFSGRSWYGTRNGTWAGLLSILFALLAFLTLPLGSLPAYISSGGGVVLCTSLVVALCLLGAACKFEGEAPAKPLSDKLVERLRTFKGKAYLAALLVCVSLTSCLFLAVWGGHTGFNSVWCALDAFAAVPLTEIKHLYAPVLMAIALLGLTTAICLLAAFERYAGRTKAQVISHAAADPAAPEAVDINCASVENAKPEHVSEPLCAFAARLLSLVLAATLITIVVPHNITVHLGLGWKFNLIVDFCMFWVKLLGVFYLIRLYKRERCR